MERVNAFCRSHQAGLAWKFLDHCYIYQYPEKIDWLQPQKESDIGPEPFIDCPAQDRHQTALPQSASVHADPEKVEEVFHADPELAFLRYSADGYDVVARGMNKAGIPQSTLVWGAVGGVVGWFIGLPLGLVLGMVAAIFIVEYLRSKDTATAWASTLQALKAFGWTIAIELIAALTSATAWGIGVALAATGN